MKKRIEQFKKDLMVWLKVSIGICFLVIFGAGLMHLYHGYEVNVEGKMIYWANPDVETQLAKLPTEQEKKAAKKVRG